VRVGVLLEFLLALGCSGCCIPSAPSEPHPSRCCGPSRPPSSSRARCRCS
jgi:hypothetical protein